MLSFQACGLSFYKYLPTYISHLITLHSSLDRGTDLLSTSWTFEYKIHYLLHWVVQTDVSSFSEDRLAKGCIGEREERVLSSLYIILLLSEVMRFLSTNARRSSSYLFRRCSCPCRDRLVRALDLLPVDLACRKSSRFGSVPIQVILSSESSSSFIGGF